MKNLARIVIAVMLVASPVFAALGVIYEEDFTGTDGANITTLGWSQDSTGDITISPTVIQSGQSAHFGRRDAAGDILYSYDFPDVVIPDSAVVDEYFQLTVATRCMDDLFYLRLNGKTHFGSNATVFKQVALSENVWNPDSSPETAEYYQVYPFVSVGQAIATEDATVLLRLVATPGVNGSLMGTSTASYSLDDGANWTVYATDPASGLWQVNSIEIIGGYTPTSGGTGGIFDTHETAFFDSIKLEVLPEPATLVMLGLGGLAALLKRRG